MSMYVRGPSGVLMAAALAATAMAEMQVGPVAVSSLSLGPPLPAEPQLRVRRYGKVRDPGPHRPAGSKLSRKAAKGRL